MSDTASKSEVKRAYLELAKKYHPDVNHGKDAEKRFSEINEAYETLGDQSKREIYDATGMSANAQQTHESQGGSFMFNPFSFAFGGTQAARNRDMRSYEEILREYEDFFRMDNARTSTMDSGSSRGKLKGRDVHCDVQIDFMDAVRGT